MAPANNILEATILDIVLEKISTDFGNESRYRPSQLSSNRTVTLKNCVAAAESGEYSSSPSVPSNSATLDQSSAKPSFAKTV